MEHVLHDFGTVIMNEGFRVDKYQLRCAQSFFWEGGSLSVHALDEGGDFAALGCRLEIL